MRKLILVPIGVALAAALVFGMPACSNNYGGASPTTPTGSPVPPANAVIIDIVGNNGAQSFTPNPATAPAGQTVVWHNRDTVTHRVVLDDGETDSGNIAPGAFSAPMVLVAPGPYHCSIHPPMVGRIVPGQ